MSVKVAINGFGRIGRNVLRAIVEEGRNDVEVVAINDLAPVETNAHLLRFDSVHGRFPHDVTAGENTIDVGRGPIEVTALRDPSALPWDGVDVALECTGVFTVREKAAAHLENGSKRVLISAPGAGADKTIVFGVNQNTLKSDDLVVSNASCTTNCLSPVAKVLHDTVGIKRGNDPELLTFEIIRDKIPIFSVDASFMVAPGIGYVKVNRFSKSTMSELYKAFAKLQEEGMEDLILDLQGNGGGMLRTAIQMADEFLSEQKLIVYTEGRSFPRDGRRDTAGACVF